MSFLFTSLFGGLSKNSPTFAKWAETTTQDDIHTLFLQVLQEGDAETGLSDAISSKELSHFDSTVSTISPSDSPDAPRQILIEAFLHHLSSLHPRHASFIQAASRPLTRLLQAHACFPFPADYGAKSLSRDGLLRTTLLLTSNCDKLFRAAGWAGEDVTVRERTAKQRIGFMFGSLVEEPGATASVDDVLDVLCRVAYPRVKDSSGDLARRDVRDLVPVAQRLVGQEGESAAAEVGGRRISREIQGELSGLIAAVNRRNVGGTSGDEGMTEDEFMSWAIKVNLLGALDKLFQAFLRN